MADDDAGKQRATPQHTPKGKFAKGNTIGFQPGQSGNPSGLPKGYQRMDRNLMRALSHDPREPEPEPKTYYEVLARKIRDQGREGESKQQDMLIRNNDGPPTQKVETDVTVKRYKFGGDDPLGLDEEDAVSEGEDDA